MVFRTVDGFVLADVNIVGIFSDGKIGAIGNVGEIAVLTRCDALRIAEELSLLECLLRPRARNDVVCLAIEHHVHGDSRELLRSTALQEEHGVFIRDA